MSRKSRSITVTLGDLQDIVDARIQSGEFGSASEVLQEALRALEREGAEYDAEVEAWLQTRLKNLDADPRPDVSLGGMRRRLENYHRGETANTERGV